MRDEIQEIYDIIEEADYLLIGCGEEFALDRLMKEEKESIYMPLKKYGIHNKEELSKIISDDSQIEWLDYLLTKIRQYNYYENNNSYDKLYEIVKNKNYFIVTTNTDSYIYKSKLSKDQIVSPCGTELLLQCATPCERLVWSSHDYLKDINLKIDEMIQALQKGELVQEHQYKPRCPKCGKEAEFNIRGEVKEYVEEGYMDQWKKYMNWLMGTMNRKIVMLELGESFLTPTVIRWPFEKNAYINNKAKLIRINEKFPQISHEIKDKSISVCINSVDLIEKLYLYVTVQPLS